MLRSLNEHYFIASKTGNVEWARHAPRRRICLPVRLHNFILLLLCIDLMPMENDSRQLSGGRHQTSDDY
jgi:hypothetical protein